MKKVVFILSLFLFILANDSYAQAKYWPIEGIWKSNSGNEFYVNYISDYYGDFIGVKTINTTTKEVIIYEKITPDYYVATITTGYLTYKQWLNINSCRSITVWTNKSTNSWTR